MHTPSVLLTTAGLLGLLFPAAASPAAPRFRPAPTPPLLEERWATVSVPFPEGTVIGRSLAGVESFRGIPFAQQPVGDLRLRPPLRLTSSIGTVDGTSLLDPSCPQMVLSSTSANALLELLGNIVNIPLLEAVGNEREDCLTINVQRPAGTTAADRLPVLFWIFGGGFELGSTATYDATDLLLHGIALDEPFLFVAVNYRVNGFGFLGGRALAAEGSTNLGLRDQRMGLEWAADNIAAFGGDPDRVTIWGESAGAISVFDQMALYGGNHTYKGAALFRGAIMDSGSMIPVGPVDDTKAQAIFDQVADVAGCGTEADDAAILACLRAAPYSTLQNAVNSVPGIVSYNSLALSYLPRPDGDVLPLSTHQLAATGQFAPVPFIIGDQEDEGTLFAIVPSNLTTTAALESYLNTICFNEASAAQVAGLVATYPTSVTAGSPFRTSIFNELWPGYKRLAAMMGDIVFTLMRRLFLRSATATHGDVPSWSYLSSYDYGLPFLGTFHASDLLQVFYGILPNYASAAIQTYYINFVHHLDPNVGYNASLMAWPQWSEDQQLMNFFNDHAALLPDTFRSESANYIGTYLDYLII